MPEFTPLIDIINSIEKIFTSNLSDKTYWIKADISSVRKNAPAGMCYLDFVDKSTGVEFCISGICLYKGYQSLKLYETMTGKTFESGINIQCKVAIKYYKAKSKPQLELLEIDYQSEVGRQELEKRQTLQRLVDTNRKHIRFENGKYYTTNNLMPLPSVIQKIALITARNSDGKRDFLKAISGKGFSIYTNEYHALMQGEKSTSEILGQLKTISSNSSFYDAVVICRGGGSDSDFHVFNDFELANVICSYPIPILTGIGHDRNSCIVDMMARQYSNPNDVGIAIIQNNLRFHEKLRLINEQLDELTESILNEAHDNLDDIKQTLKNLSPDYIMKKGFAILSLGEKIITNSKSLKKGDEITALLKGTKINSKISKISKK
jgi:exodeoxyribonuclease VII large subunit